MVNILVPLFVQPFEIVGKVAKQLLKLYKEDPEDWLPDAWLQPQQKPLFVPTGGEQVPGAPPGGEAPTMPGAEKIQPEMKTPTSAVGKLMQGLGKLNPFQ